MPGHYVGVVLSTQAAQRGAGFAYLEGNTKMWIDGEPEQSLEYTGLEDYYQGAWYYARTGSMLLASGRRTRASQYRFHPEGIPFARAIRVASHHGEFDEIQGNYSSVAYWYQSH